MERPAEAFGAFRALAARQTAGSKTGKNRWLESVAARVAVERLAEAFRSFERLRPGKRHARNPVKTDGWSLWRRELPWKGNPNEGPHPLGLKTSTISLRFSQLSAGVSRSTAFISSRPEAQEESSEAGFTVIFTSVATKQNMQSDGWSLWLRELPWKGVREHLEHFERLERLKPSKRQAWTPLKTDGWSVWLRELPWQTAALNTGKNEWLQPVGGKVALERHAQGFAAFGAFEGKQTACFSARKNRWLEPVAARVAMDRTDGWSVWLRELPRKSHRKVGHVPHLRWSQAPPLPWRRPGSADKL